jgi:hypothetical protein
MEPSRQGPVRSCRGSARLIWRVSQAPGGMNSRPIGVIVASFLVTQCASRSAAPQRTQALLVEEAALDAAAPVPDDVYRVRDRGVSPPVLVRSVYSEYTPEAMRAKVRGSVFSSGHR